MGRHELREQVFRLLFRVEFNDPREMEEQKLLFPEDLPAEDNAQAVGRADADYITDRCGKVQEKIAEIDRLIDENMEGWDIGRIGKVELAVLRLAVYEILFDDEIPDGVAIDEAVEIAKQYGQESSGGFVNAILAKIVKKSENDS